MVQTLLIFRANSTNRSVLAVLLFHGMMNPTGECRGLAAAAFPLMLAGNLPIAAVLIVAWRRLWDTIDVG